MKDYIIRTIVATIILCVIILLIHNFAPLFTKNNEILQSDTLINKDIFFGLTNIEVSAIHTTHHPTILNISNNTQFDTILIIGGTLELLNDSTAIIRIKK